MKVKVEITYNKQSQSSIVEYEDFSVDSITEKLKFPNFKPKLTRMFHEDSTDSCTILNLQYSNANSKKSDQVMVRIIPLFAVMDIIMSRVA